MARIKKPEKGLNANMADDEERSSITITMDDGMDVIHDFLAQLSPDVHLAACFKETPQGKKAIKITLLKDDSNIVINKDDIGSLIYKSLIDNSNSAIFLTKPNGEIIEVNTAAETMFGYTKKEFVKLGRQGTIDADENLNLLLAQRRETGRAIGELTGIKKTGIKFPVEVTSAIFKDHFGEEYTCTILQDITNRKKADEQTLLMLNNTEECFVLLNRELIILNFNKQFKNLYKRYFDLTVAKGLSIEDFVKPERLADAKEIYEAVLNGEIIIKQLDIKEEDGEDDHFKIKYAPSKNEANEIIGIFITLRDITNETRSNIEIEKRQKQLEQAEINYREIFEKANDAIFIHDIYTGQILDVNTKGCALFGKTKSEIISADPSIFATNTPGYTYDVAKNKLTKAAEGTPQLFEWICRHNDGTLNWVEVSLQNATIAGSERILAYYRIINDRINSEIQIELERKDKEALINSTDDLIWSIDCDYKLIAANNAYIDMLGSISAKPHKVGNDVWLEEFGEAVNNKWKLYYQRAFAGEKYSIEDQFSDPVTNRDSYELISFNPIFKDENVIGVACYSKNITALTENQLAVKATNAELDNVMASSQDMICTVAEDNTIERVSEASEVILGYKPEELIGKYIFDFVYHDDTEITKLHAQEVMTGKGSPNYYNRYVRKDGSLVYLEWTAKWNEQSKKRYGVARDVSAKVEADNKLKSSEQRFKSLVQDGSDLIGILNDDGTYKYVSPTSYAILGFEPEEFIGKNAFDFIHPDDVQIVQDHFALLQINKKVALPHFRFRNQKGEWRWMETLLTNLMDEPSINGIVANSRDITERKNIEKALMDTKENYKNLFENSPAPMFIFDFETLQIIDCNEETLLKYGYTKQEFLQLTIKDIRPVEDITKIEEAVETEDAYGKIHKKIWRHKKKNGEIMYMDITGHLINYAGRKVSIVMLIDVTERLKMEERSELEKVEKEMSMQILKDKDAKLENAQRIARLGYWQRNLTNNSVYWSKEIFNIWEIPDTKIPDFHFFVSTIHPSDVEKFLAASEYASKNNKELNEEYRIIMANGAIKWIHEKARLVKNENEEDTFLAGTAQDITERKNAERKIYEINQRYDHVTKATYDAIWEWDVVNNTIYRAEGFERSFGFNLTEINNPETVWENFIHTDDRENANASIQSAIKSNKDYWSHEYRLIKPNGEQAFVEDRAYILRNKKGEAQRIIGALRDITERKYYHDLEILEREILETNARGQHSLEAVIEKYILGIEHLHPGMIGSMQKVENNRLYNLSSPRLPKPYLEAISGLEIGDNVGSCGTAAYLKQNVVVTDIATDIRWANYKAVAINVGLKSCWSYPVFDSKNKIIATFAIYYKIVKAPTEQEENTIKRAGNILQTILESYHREAALQESNKRYENVTNATSDAIWDYDFATDEIYVGKGYEKLFGHKIENSKAKLIMWNEHLYKEDKQRVLDKLDIVIKDKSINNWSEEYRYVKADGSIAFVMNKGIVIRDEKGWVIRMIGAMQDITRQKEEEQRLKLMSSVVTSTNDAILITEAEPFDEPGQRIIYVNEAFCKMTGYTATEVIGKTPRILQGPNTDKVELGRIGEAMRNWKSCETTVLNYKKNGEEFWINFTLSPVADEKGWYTHWISVERDVTDRKNDELQKELLRKIRIIFNEPFSINETLDKVLKDVTLFGGFCFAESWLITADKKEIKRATYYVAEPGMRSILTETSKLYVKKGEGLVGRAWEKLALQLWENGAGLKNILDEDVFINAGVKKLYALPFLNNAEIIGVLVFGVDKQESAAFKFKNLFSSLEIYLGAEIRRKQLEQELNQIFNFAPDIIVIAGLNGYFKKLNPAASELLEYSLEELMARPYMEFVHPEDVNKTVEEVNQLNSGRTIFYFENRYLTKSGKIKWLAWTCTPSPEEEVIFAVAKDITEKKDLEVVLDKANNLARIGSWELDFEKNTLYWSEMTKEIHHVLSDFQPTLAIAIHFYKEGINREAIISSLNKAIKEGTPWDLELQIITENNIEKWIRSIGEAEFSNGKCIKIYGSFQDIDQRKRAEETIRSGEERRELIMNAALDAIVCIDKNDIVTFWNPQAELIFGWTENEAIGKLLSTLVIPEQYRLRHQQGMNSYFKTRKGQALNLLVQFSALRKNGEEFPIELTVLPIEQDGNEFFCAFIRDITERKLSETRLLELNDSLQKQTLQLAGINKELEQFAYVASHDLQEPLRMITSFITQLEKKYANVLDEKGKKYIYFAVDGARRMRLIILDLLEYSKIGRIDELKEDIDLNEIVEEIKILYVSKIEEREANIIATNLPVISSYKSPVKQVFQNLISNALKYCEDNNPCRVIISAEDIGTHWHFSITDNGIGINKDYFERIFIIFQRLHAKDTYSGTGMGLALTKKIIENLHGKIWVESVEGEGSVFHFTLPNN